jgi:hypothetical protein
MYSNQQLMAYSIAFENSSTPFRFYQTNILLEPDRTFFPYTNWFRGQYTSCFPIIADREAGFYPRTEQKITECSMSKDKEKKPTHCFRGATQQARKCYTVDNTTYDHRYTNKWVQTDPSYLGNEPILSYI